MSKKDLQKDIRNYGGFGFSHNTHDIQTLLCKAYDVIVGYNIRSAYDLADEIAEVIHYVGGPTQADTARFYGLLPDLTTEETEQGSYLFNEKVFNLFNDIAPNGYYFGVLEGDGACFGWWKIPAEEVI